MKNKFYALLFLVFAAANCYAAPPSDSQIYDALNIPEKILTPPGMLGSVSSEKSVGGLVCKSTKVVAPHARANVSCAIRQTLKSDEEIYIALAVTEKNTTPPGLMGAVSFEKSVGRLVCKKTGGVGPKAKFKYSCRLFSLGANFMQGAESKPEESAE